VLDFEGFSNFWHYGPFDSNVFDTEESIRNVFSTGPQSGARVMRNSAFAPGTVAVVFLALEDTEIEYDVTVHVPKDYSAKDSGTQPIISISRPTGEGPKVLSYAVEIFTGELPLPVPVPAEYDLTDVYDMVEDEMNMLAIEDGDESFRAAPRGRQTGRPNTKAGGWCVLHSKQQVVFS
jgi:hypothetical protein